MASEAPIRPVNYGPFKARAAEDDTPQGTHEEGGLASFDVFSLIVNKMVGSGIFTSPAVVYRMTGSKSITLALFGVGFLYCLMSTAIYLQYAKAFPFNGGELIYLDEITSSKTPTSIDTTKAEAHQSDDTELTVLSSDTRSLPPDTRTIPVAWYKKLSGDGLLTYIIYSLAFIIFFNSATNSQQFGRMILLCIHAEKEDIVDEVQNDQHLMRYIAVSILSIICLTQFFSPNFGRKLNRYLAVIKIGFLVGLVAVGLIAVGRDLNHGSKGSISRSEDWSRRHEVNSKLSFAKALLVVLFSFEGWENATFVAGDIPPKNQKTLRRGFLAATCTVGSLYLVVVAISLNSLGWGDVSGVTSINYPPMLSGDTPKARRTWAIIVSISAFGSLNAIIYTFSRVKQVIGQADVLPWSRFLKQDDCLNRRQRPEQRAFQYKSPQGGLIAHWSASVALIAASASIESTLESIGLAGYIQTYTHCFILMVLGIGYFNLKPPHDSPNSTEEHEEPQTWGGKYFEALVLVCTPIYVLLNLAIIVINAVPPYKSSGDQTSVFPGYAFPVIVVSLIAAGTLYYLLFFGAVCRSYEVIQSHRETSDGSQFSRVCEKGILSPQSPLNLMKYAGVACEMRKDYSYNKSLERVFRFGRRWKMVYSIPKYDSDEPNSTPAGEQRLTFEMALYWAFGGSRLKKSPWARLQDYKHNLFRGNDHLNHDVSH